MSLTFTRINVQKSLWIILWFSFFLWGGMQLGRAEAGEKEKVAVPDSILQQIEATQKLYQSLSYQSGKINLLEGQVALDLTGPYRYLNSTDSKTLLVNILGNHPDAAEGVLGVIVPSGVDLQGDSSWFAVLQFNDMGYVEDDDAEDIDYEELLQEMKEDAKTVSEERVKAGYEAIQIIGWASKPFYDKATHKLHWAKEIKFGTSASNTLNYNVRILGRKGVLEVNVVAGMAQFKQVSDALPNIFKVINFQSGSSYSDFNPDIDKVAAVGIGGLIAGKLLAKAGVFALILKFIKPILIGIGLAGAGLWRFITGRKKRKEEEETAHKSTPAAAPPPPTENEDKPSDS